MPFTVNAEAAECPIQLNSLVLQQELSDVQICVFEDQKDPTLFHAHKLLLAAASDVFKTMFFGSVPQDNPVVIKDSNPAAFEAFLKYIYSGTTTITEADVFPLLYLGKKYMVGSLTRIAMNCLEGCITSENVGEIIFNGQNFLDDAPPKFWQSVVKFGEALLESNEFLQLRKDTVHALVQLELPVEEKFIYDRVVAWAAAECARNQLPLDGGTLRSALDGILQHVRFPTMTAEEFAEGPAADAVLTSEEKIQVLKWFSAAIPQSIFPDTPRCEPEIYVCERLAISYWGPWNANGYADAIDFSVNQAVSITGLGAYSVYNDGSQTGRSYSIVAQLARARARGNAVLASKGIIGTMDQSPQKIPVNFDMPIKIDANKRYTVSVVVNGPTCYGGNGSSSKTVSTRKGDVLFTFKESYFSSGNTTSDDGQIPQIFFRF